MSLGCAMCGDCCERIHINMAGSVRAEMSKRLADPRVCGKVRREAVFISTHWHPTGDVVARNTGVFGVTRASQTMTCDAFDPVERLCTAHNDRPAVCSGFPFYGDGPQPDSSIEHKRCSFLLDLPRSTWPDGARPMLPLTVIS